MIQRIQSIYLFLASLFLFALYLFPLVHHIDVANVPSMIKVTGVYQDAGAVQNHSVVFVALSILTAAIALLPLAIIFFYKHRSRQVALSYSTILVIIGYSFWVAQTVKSITGGVIVGTNNMGIGLFLAPISIVFIIMAIKAIQRDEKLVKSADRLR